MQSNLHLCWNTWRQSIKRQTSKGLPAVRRYTSQYTIYYEVPTHSSATKVKQCMTLICKSLLVATNVHHVDGLS